MSEYIKREKAQEVIVNYGKGAISDGQKTLDPVDDIILLGKAVDMIPSADVAEVVRCGQCKHWKINPNSLYGGQCRFSECASIDHFCSRGERKDGASDA